MASTSNSKRGLLYRCFLCPYNGEKTRVFRHYIQCHVQEVEVPFSCSLCGCRTYSQQSLNSHPGWYPKHNRLARKFPGMAEWIAIVSQTPYAFNFLTDVYQCSREDSVQHWQMRAKPDVAPKTVPAKSESEVVAEEGVKVAEEEVVSQEVVLVAEESVKGAEEVVSEKKVAEEEVVSEKKVAEEEVVSQEVVLVAEETVKGAEEVVSEKKVAEEEVVVEEGVMAAEEVVAEEVESEDQRKVQKREERVSEDVVLEEDSAEFEEEEEATNIKSSKRKRTDSSSSASSSASSDSEDHCNEVKNGLEKVVSNVKSLNLDMSYYMRKLERKMDENNKLVKEQNVLLSQMLEELKKKPATATSGNTTTRPRTPARNVRSVLGRVYNYRRGTTPHYNSRRRTSTTNSRR